MCIQKIVGSESGLNIQIQNPSKIERFIQYSWIKDILEYQYLNFIDSLYSKKKVFVYGSDPDLLFLEVRVRFFLEG